MVRSRVESFEEWKKRTKLRLRAITQFQCPSEKRFKKWLEEEGFGIDDDLGYSLRLLDGSLWRLDSYISSTSFDLIPLRKLTYSYELKKFMEEYAIPYFCLEPYIEPVIFTGSSMLELLKEGV
jgi:hypothetical protein